MGLIKSSQTPASIAAFSMSDIEGAARALLVRARQQADQIIAAAQAEAQQLRARASLAGEAEGRKQGLAEGAEAGKKAAEEAALGEQRARFEQAAATLTSTANALENHRAQLEAMGLQEVVKLAAAIARRVTKRQGLIDPQVLLENLDASMRVVVDAADVRIAIHPTQRAVLDVALPKLRLSFPSLKHVEIIDEDAISPGGCRVFTRDCLVDADLGVQLDRVINELLPAPDGGTP